MSRTNEAAYVSQLIERKIDGARQRAGGKLGRRAHVDDIVLRKVDVVGVDGGERALQLILRTKATMCNGSLAEPNCGASVGKKKRRQVSQRKQ